MTRQRRVIWEGFPAVREAASTVEVLRFRQFADALQIPTPFAAPHS
jgi:hypothetical protein